MPSDNPPLKIVAKSRRYLGPHPWRVPGMGWDPTHPPLAPPPLPRPAFLRTWHRRPGEGKAQEVAEEDKEEEDETEEG